MAIAPTGAIYKALTFDGTSSRTFGVYITGAAVYNAPERAVEMISIPGRNGAFALDSGRFENLEVKYPAGVFADNEADFAQAVSDFRNFLCSKKGYVRLTDEYNPNEYRMAVYKSGLEVTPAQLRAGEFDLVFECKPQRWLTSGETAVPVADGDTLTNPTLFDARPLLAVEGYGNICINDSLVTLKNITYGETIAGPMSSMELTGSIVFVDSHINAGDDLWLSSAQVTQTASLKSGYTHRGSSVTSVTNNGTATISDSGRRRTLTATEINFKYGTASTETYLATYYLYWKTSVNSYTGSGTLELSLAYDGDHTIAYTITYAVGTPYNSTSVQIQTQNMRADSTASALGHPAYIDLDIGVAWNEDSGTPTSMNSAVELPAVLPVLVPGANLITFDNTITDLQITPRWWKV